MDDPAFPDSHYTTTATTTNTTTTVQSPPLTLDKAYLTSVPGILRIVQIGLNLVYLILILACADYMAFPVIVSVMSLLLTIIFFVMFLMQLNKRVTTVKWVTNEMVDNISWTIMHLIAACIVAKRASDYGQNRQYLFFLGLSYGCTAIAAVIGFALMVLYGLSTFFNVMEFKAGGGLGQLTGRVMDHSTEATSTEPNTTEPNTQYPVEEKGPDQ